MKDPKCRTCGEHHRLGECPLSFKSSRGGGESRPADRRVADKATAIVRTAEVAGKPIGRNTSQTAQDGPKNLPAVGVAPSPREAKSNSDADRSVPVRKPKPVPQPPSPKASAAASGSTTHQYRDPEKRKAYMAKYMRDRRRREAEKRSKEKK